MDNKGIKNPLPEEEYLKQMSSLPKAKAPEDFLERVRAHIDKRSALEKIINTLFVPFRVKVPLEVAAVAATLLLIISVFEVTKPTRQLVSIPISGLEKAKERRIELALSVGAKAPSLPYHYDRTESLEKTSLKMEERSSAEAERPADQKTFLAEALLKVRKEIELVQGKETYVGVDKDSGVLEYVDAEIPAGNYGRFVDDLKNLGLVQGPVIKEAPEGRVIIQVRIKFLNK